MVLNLDKLLISMSNNVGLVLTVSTGDCGSPSMDANSIAHPICFLSSVV